MASDAWHEDIPIWIDGAQKWMTGLTRRTTCDDIIYALLHARGLLETDSTDNYAVFERWRAVERPLQGRTKIVKVWTAWGREQPNVQLLVQRLDDYFIPPEASKTRRRHRRSSRQRAKHTNSCRCAGTRLQCAKCGRTRAVEQLAKHLLKQERHLQELRHRVQDTDRQIAQHEARQHARRVQQNGADYVQDSYLFHRHRTASRRERGAEDGGIEGSSGGSSDLSFSSSTSSLDSIDTLLLAVGEEDLDEFLDLCEGLHDVLTRLEHAQRTQHALARDIQMEAVDLERQKEAAAAEEADMVESLRLKVTREVAASVLQQQQEIDVVQELRLWETKVKDRSRKLCQLQQQLDNHDKMIEQQSLNESQHPKTVVDCVPLHNQYQLQQQLWQQQYYLDREDNQRPCFETDLDSQPEFTKHHFERAHRLLPCEYQPSEMTEQQNSHSKHAEYGTEKNTAYNICWSGNGLNQQRPYSPQNEERRWNGVEHSPITLNQIVMEYQSLNLALDENGDKDNSSPEYFKIADNFSVSMDLPQHDTFQRQLEARQYSANDSPMGTKATPMFENHSYADNTSSPTMTADASCLDKHENCNMSKNLNNMSATAESSHTQNSNYRDYSNSDWKHTRETDMSARTRDLNRFDISAGNQRDRSISRDRARPRSRSRDRLDISKPPVPPRKALQSIPSTSDNTHTSPGLQQISNAPLIDKSRLGRNYSISNRDRSNSGNPISYAQNTTDLERKSVLTTTSSNSLWNISVSSPVFPRKQFATSVDVSRSRSLLKKSSLRHNGSSSSHTNLSATCAGKDNTKNIHNDEATLRNHANDTPKGMADFKEGSETSLTNDNSRSMDITDHQKHLIAFGHLIHNDDLAKTISKVSRGNTHVNGVLNGRHVDDSVSNKMLREQNVQSPNNRFENPPPPPPKPLKPVSNGLYGDRLCNGDDSESSKYSTFQDSQMTEPSTHNRGFNDAVSSESPPPPPPRPTHGFSSGNKSSQLSHNRVSVPDDQETCYSSNHNETNILPSKQALPTKNGYSHQAEPYSYTYSLLPNESGLVALSNGDDSYPEATNPKESEVFQNGITVSTDRKTHCDTEQSGFRDTVTHSPGISEANSHPGVCEMSSDIAISNDCVSYPRTHDPPIQPLSFTPQRSSVLALGLLVHQRHTELIASSRDDSGVCSSDSSTDSGMLLLETAADHADGIGQAARRFNPRGDPDNVLDLSVVSFVSGHGVNRQKINHQGTERTTDANYDEENSLYNTGDTGKHVNKPSFLPVLSLPYVTSNYCSSAGTALSSSLSTSKQFPDKFCNEENNCIDSPTPPRRLQYPDLSIGSLPVDDETDDDDEVFVPEDDFNLRTHIGTENTWAASQEAAKEAKDRIPKCFLSVSHQPSTTEENPVQIASNRKPSTANPVSIIKPTSNLSKPKPTFPVPIINTGRLKQGRHDPSSAKTVRFAEEMNSWAWCDVDDDEGESSDDTGLSSMQGDEALETLV